MDTLQMLQKLQGATRGSQVFVSYLAGRPAMPAAIRQARRARRLGINRRHFTGSLVDVWRTRRGQIVMTLFVNERDSANGKPGNYRTFNPSLGRLISVELLQR